MQKAIRGGVFQNYSTRHSFKTDFFNKIIGQGIVNDIFSKANLVVIIVTVQLNPTMSWEWSNK